MPANVLLAQSHTPYFQASHWRCPSQRYGMTCMDDTLHNPHMVRPFYWLKIQLFGHNHKISNSAILILTPKWKSSNPAILIIKPSCILVKLLQHSPKRHSAPSKLRSGAALANVKGFLSQSRFSQICWASTVETRITNPTTLHKSISLEHLTSCELPLMFEAHNAKQICPSPAKNSVNCSRRFRSTFSFEPRSTTSKIRTAGACQRSNSNTTITAKLGNTWN